MGVCFDVDQLIFCSSCLHVESPSDQGGHVGQSLRGNGEEMRKTLIKTSAFSESKLKKKPKTFKYDIVSNSLLQTQQKKAKWIRMTQMKTVTTFSISIAFIDLILNSFYPQFPEKLKKLITNEILI